MTGVEVRIDPATEHEHAMVREIWLGRRGRIRAYIFELATGIAYLLSGLAFLISPRAVASHSLIGRQVYPFDTIWSVLEVLGGVLLLAGVLKPVPRLRVAGLLLLGTALMMWVTAGFLTAPQLRVAFNLVYALACFTRAWLIVRLFYRVQAAQ